MYPAPIVMADRTRKKIRETLFKYYWRTEHRYHLLPVAFLLTPLIFHYPLPLRAVEKVRIQGLGGGKV
jgi:hypothetical protein